LCFTQSALFHAVPAVLNIVLPVPTADPFQPVTGLLYCYCVMQLEILYIPNVRERVEAFADLQTHLRSLVCGPP
ncbi:hypothetical protein, partial [Mycobacteroides abscessus]|uniref:hypothetical protein n=1 Tax=Mycobacteroides abscessus TaxID=36809 RepID=UPI001C8AE7CD